MSNNNKTPAIRFKGFTDTWEQRGFSSVFEILQNNTLSRADLCDESGLAQNIHYGDVLIKYGEVLDVGNEPLAYINSDKIVTAMKNSYLQNGDVIIADTAEDATVGKCSEIANLGDKTVLSGLHTIPVRPKEEYASGYLGYYLNSNSYHDTLIPLMQGTKVTSISKSALQGTSISYPKSLDEQAEISAYFQNLDNLITLHQRKCDKLIQFKAAMLKKMFPQNGADKPELRFKGFTDAWEQRKLGELMEITSVKRIHQSDWTDSGVRFLRARDIVAVSKNEEVSDPLFISQEKYDEYSALSGKVKIGDLLVTGVGTIGVPMLINNEEPLYFKDGNIIWFKNEDRIDGEFFYHSFNGSFIQNFIKESAGIGTVGTYTIESGKKTPILLPTQKDEQQKIGTFFSQLDTLITLHQRKCDKYKSIKAGLIRKFFP